MCVRDTLRVREGNKQNDIKRQRYSVNKTNIRDRDRKKENSEKDKEGEMKRETE